MTNIVGEWIVAISASAELSMVAKATVILAMGLTAASLAPRARASTRHLLLALTFGGVLVLPAASFVAPRVEIPVPVAQAADVRATPAEPGDRSVIRRTIVVTGSSETSGGWSLPSWPSMARGVWLTGVLLFLMSLAKAVWRVRRLRGTGLPWGQPRPLVQSLAADAGIRRAIEILQHEDVAVPLTSGVLRPAVLLPPDASSWDAADLRRALVHEVEHVRRSDWAVHLMARAACAVYWFHPLVWTAWRRLALEAERACDDAVLAGAERTAYAEQLVALARRLSGSEAQPTLAMANRSDLSARVSAILDGTQRRGRLRLTHAIVAVTVAAIIVAAFAPVRAIGNPAQPLAAGVSIGNATPGATPTSAPTPTPTPTATPTQNAELIDGLVRVQEELQTGVRLPDVLQAAVSQAIRPSRLGRPLLEAASEGNLEDIAALIAAGADVNARIDGDGSPLIVAAREGMLNAVRWLLDHGADPNIVVEGDGSPLIMAAREGHLEIVALLLDRGASVDLVVPGDESALIQASAEGHLRVVQLLVGRGADVNARVWVDWEYRQPNGAWRSALSMARRERHDAVVDYLISAGARQ